MRTFPFTLSKAAGKTQVDRTATLHLLFRWYSLLLAYMPRPPTHSSQTLWFPRPLFSVRIVQLVPYCNSFLMYWKQASSILNTNLQVWHPPPTKNDILVWLSIKIVQPPHPTQSPHPDPNITHISQKLLRARPTRLHRHHASQPPTDPHWCGLTLCLPVWFQSFAFTASSLFTRKHHQSHC